MLSRACFRVDSVRDLHNHSLSVDQEAIYRKFHPLRIMYQFSHVFYISFVNYDGVLHIEELAMKATALKAPGDA